MYIAHGHCKRRMTQDFLKREDVAAIHHKVTSEGVPQGMAGLALRQLNRGALQGAAEGRNAGCKRPMYPPMRPHPVSQLFWNRYVANLARLGSGIDHNVALELLRGKLFGLRPSNTGSQSRSYSFSSLTPANGLA